VFRFCIPNAIKVAGKTLDVMAFLDQLSGDCHAWTAGEPTWKSPYLLLIALATGIWQWIWNRGLRLQTLRIISMDCVVGTWWCQWFLL